MDFKASDFNHYANEIVSSLPQNYDYTTSYLLYTSLQVLFMYLSKKQSLSSVTILLEQVFLMIDIIITIVAAYVIYILMLSSIKEKMFLISAFSYN